MSQTLLRLMVLTLDLDFQLGLAPCRSAEVSHRRHPWAAWDYERELHGQLDTHLGVFDLDGCEYGRLALQEGRYHIRLLRQGRDHVEAALTPEEFPPGEPHEDPLETWLLQLWTSK